MQLSNKEPIAYQWTSTLDKATKLSLVSPQSMTGVVHDTIIRSNKL